MITQQKFTKMITTFDKLPIEKKKNHLQTLLADFEGSESIFGDMQKIIGLDDAPESFLDFSYKFLIERLYKLDQETALANQKNYQKKIDKMKAQLELEAQERTKADEELESKLENM